MDTEGKEVRACHAVDECQVPSSLSLISMTLLSHICFRFVASSSTLALNNMHDFPVVQPNGSLILAVR